MCADLWWRDAWDRTKLFAGRAGSGVGGAALERARHHFEPQDWGAREMDKLIEMTLDGRLSMILLAVILILLWVIYELWSCRPRHKRSVAYRRKQRKNYW